MRYMLGDDRNYDILVREAFAYENRLTQIVIADTRNGGIVSNAQVEARKAHQSVQSLLNAIKQEKKILENMGLKQAELNSKKASKKRPKKNELEESLDDCIAKLARHHAYEKPSEIWFHLAGKISEWSGGDVRETGNKIEVNQKYHFNVDGKDKTISFETFRKKLAKMRKGI